jgi:1-pyrroline-5-carboxylate dehydrogenase
MLMSISQVYVYDDADFDKTLDLINTTSEYALTGAMYVLRSSFLCASYLLVSSSFSSERQALIQATNKLRHAAGNVYYNEKCTGAVVGQQPFGGGRASGTNDKAGSIAIFYRFVSMRSIKENFIGLEEFNYPSNLV